MPVLLVLLCVAAADADASVLLPVRRPVVKMTGGEKQIALPVARRLAPAQVERPEKRSPLSLEGQAFNHIGRERLLSKEDAAHYARIFVFQDVGDFEKANEEIGKLGDHRLMGYVLYERYVSREYKSTYRELADWMKSYASLPGAQKIYDLAQKRKPKKGAGDLASPRPGRGMTGYHDYDSGQLAKPYAAEQGYTPDESKIVKSISRNLSERPSRAQEQLESPEAKKLFNATKYDDLRAQIAESYFYNGKASQAYELAAASSDRSGKDVPLAGWIAGLSAWKKGDYDEAAKHFERTANSPRASAWMASAGAHWAARSYLRGRRPQKISHWLRQSAKSPRSFYGIISVKILGMEQARFNWGMPELNDRMTKAMADIPAGKRALALMDAGRPDLAEKELRQINPGNNKTLQEAMIVLASKAGSPSFEMRLGSGLKDRKGHPYDSALYPDAPWRPEGGYQLDRALVYAFIRQESKFDAAASNRSSGAVGLMQLLPSTAMNVARKIGIRIDRKQLQDPAVNILLGQRYLADLMQEEAVKDNLFKLAVAYNAGPGKLSRWERNIDYEDDALLFIESIPVAETRVFVERVLTNYWIYRLKYNQNTDSLEKVASGDWPVYAAEDIRHISRFAAASGVSVR
ncbi:MAG: lytic transglycosylase domain-containing protein [Pseudomonadota bacterium]